jgi:hypothetical protein
MGLCRYCGQSAGMFHKVHEACEAAHAQAVQKILEFCERYLESSVTPSRFHELITELAEKDYVPDEELHELVVSGIKRLIAHTQAQRILNANDCDRIGDLYDLFGLTRKELTLAEIPQKLMMNLALKSLDEGKIISNPLKDDPPPLKWSDLRYVF